MGGPQRGPVRSVAVLTPWFPNRPGDAAGAFIADSALAVARAGWRVSVLVVRPWLARLHRLAGRTAGGKIQQDAFAPVAVTTIHVPALPRLTLRPLTDVISDRMIGTVLDHVARSVSADVIHAQTEGFGPIPAEVARRLDLPLVTTVHGINTHPEFLHAPYQRSRIRSGLIEANRTILVGEPLRKFFKGYLGDDEKFRVVPNGTDIPPSSCDKSILNDGSRRLITIANLQEGKGIDIALRALASLENRGIVDWTYRIIGGGAERANLAKLAEDLGLIGKVTFTGAVRRAEIFEHLAWADVFVLPSYREAFGIAYLEAMAAGLLTIGVMGEGPSQFIRNGENGLLAPPRDVDALSQILHDVLTGDRQHWREMAAQGRETVRNAYTWDHHAAKLITLYEQVIFESQSR